VFIDEDRALSSTGIAGEQGLWRFDPQDLGGDACCSQQCGSATCNGNTVALKMQAAVLDPAGTFVEGKILPWDGSDNQPGHLLKSSS
jgi:hypothetical protein